MPTPFPSPGDLTAQRLLYILVQGVLDGSIYFPVTDPTALANVTVNEPKQRLCYRLAKSST
jgi:hypothetical protein